MSVLRLGVIADPHLALERTEDAVWHNPFRLADAHERLDVALAHPLLDHVDVVAVLGDLAHFGDRASVRYVVDAVANGDRPAILLSGNHDVLTPGVRLEDEVRGRRRARHRAGVDCIPVRVGVGTRCRAHPGPGSLGGKMVVRCRHESVVTQ